ncbi:hypothetical protein [Pectinatus frisingensis]|uniref:hypothetical protein n=1 Tax=Pectinatus frisingensis TaxID=865 RepID=UPI0018C857F4|nr:hypothetical protein [Pectinatus frisingensis]
MNEYVDKINDGRDHNRMKLYNVVPLTVPFAVSVSPSDLCNFRCNYCNWSTSAGIKDAKIISWNEFLIIIDQLKQLCVKRNQKIKVFRLSNVGEPLLNKKVPDMVRRGCGQKVGLSLCDQS